MSNYHKDYTYWSKSLLSKFLESPKRAFIYMNSEFNSDTKAMNFGRAYHSYIEGVDDFVVIDEEKRPDFTKGMTANVNKEWLKKIKESSDTVISKEEYCQIVDMVETLKYNSVFCKMCGEQKNEEVFKAVINGFKLKCKPDRILTKQCLIVDWKTCESVNERKIKYAINDYNYDMQSAIYSDIMFALTGVKHNFLFMFQEKTAPYEVLPVLVRHTSDVMEQGRQKYLEACKRAKESFETGIYKTVSEFYENQILELL